MTRWYVYTLFGRFLGSVYAARPRQARALARTVWVEGGPRVSRRPPD